LEYLSIKESGKAKQNIKRSIFVGNAFYSDSEDMAKGFIKEMSEKHKTATHNCWAYKVMNDGNIVSNFSDAGEPHGSAGKPIFSSIEKMNLFNITVIVTRYFGGVKLGVRGLIDAYRSTALEALKNTDLYDYSDGIKITFKTSYKNWDEFNRIFKENFDFILNDSTFSENVKITISLKKNFQKNVFSYFDKKNITISEEKNIIFIKKTK
jgi:uncharacterized YigZ family protein